MHQVLDEAAKQFRIPGHVEFFKGHGGLEYVQLSHDSGSSAQVYLLGSTVTSWKVGNDELLFVRLNCQILIMTTSSLVLSKKSNFQEGKAIRGGIPICWPQFGPGALPNHGLVRDKLWTVRKAKLRGGDVTVVLTMKENQQMHEQWNQCWGLDYEITLTEKTLWCLLRVRNEGTVPLECTTALHTYFRVSNIANVKIEGLKDVEYVDKVKGGQVAKEEREIVTIEGETDRVFRSAPSQIVLRDTPHRIISIQKSTSFPDAVVWNVGPERVKTFADMEPQEYQDYVCVESGNIAKAAAVKPKGLWEAWHKFTHAKL